MAEALRPEWELFVQEFLVDLNATKAAKRAGFGNTDESAGKAGFRLSKNVHVKRAIRKEFKKRLNHIKVAGPDITQQLALILMSDVQDYEVNEKTGRLITLRNRQSSKAVASVKVRKTYKGADILEVTTEYRLWDKLRAAELLMKHMGMLDDDKPARESSPDERRQSLTERASRILERRRSSLN